MRKEKVLDAYAEGSTVELISFSFDITVEQVLEILRTYKEENRYKRTFTDNFKRLIAERDSNGVARKSIAIELAINSNTVKKSCEEFGNILKGKAEFENEFTKIDGEFSKEECPSCKSKEVNEVEENTYYCMSCGSEHVFYDGYVEKLNWEYLSED